MYRIEAPEADYLYKKKSQIPDSGRGLFTAIDIYKDEIIAFFKGEILTYTQAEQRAQEGRDKYFINLPDGSIMDSMNVKCFAKYANDAKGSVSSKFKNNAVITINEQDKVCIKATRNIKANEELFCGYGVRYWKKHSI
jgi:uncharacterized protein